MITGRRFIFESRKYTWQQWLYEYWLNIKCAIKTLPADTYTMEIEVDPGDPRFKDAPLEEVIVYHKDVFTILNEKA